MTFWSDGNLLHPSGKLDKGKEFDKSLLKDVFSDPFKEEPKQEVSTKKKKAREINSKNLSSLNSEDIKDRTWENIKPCQKLNGSNEVDLRAMRPSRSTGETDNGGTGILVKLNDFTKAKDSKQTKTILQDAKNRRKEAEEKKFNRSAREDWEVVSGVTKTSDVRGGTIGTARTAFEPAPVQEVKLTSVENEIKKSKKSELAGIEAAKIKRELDKIMWEKDQERYSGKNWEEDAYNEIHRNKTKEMKSPEEAPNLSRQFTPLSGAKGSGLDCTGIFDIPQNPNEVHEKPIKRDSSKLQEKRMRREEDRSWETMSNVKSKKY